MDEFRKRSTKKKSTGWKVFWIVLTLLTTASGVFFYSTYRDMEKAAADIYEPVDTDSLRTLSTDLNNKEPISILFLGVDTGELGRTEQGRSDSMIVATINPNTQKTTLLSIPRDTYSLMVGYAEGEDYYDKINHAYAYGGTEVAINSVQELLGIPIDYYVTVNMAGLEQIVDAIGGIKVDSPFAFSFYEDETGITYTFEEGENQLDGASALAFARMRYDDPEGDTGRQARQRLVIESLLKKFASLNNILNYKNVLRSTASNIETNFQMEDYVSLMRNDYLSATNNIQQEKLAGVDDMMDGVYYHFVEETEFDRIETLLLKELESY